MFKLFVVVCAIASLVQSAPQISEIELKDQAFNRINEAEYDYKWVHNASYHGKYKFFNLSEDLKS